MNLPEPHLIEEAAQGIFADLKWAGIAAPEMDESNFDGLQCDAPTCDWSDMTIPFEDYEKHVNAPCPKCGSNILTERDFITATTMNATFKRVGELFREAGFVPNPDAETVAVRLQSDGNGHIMPKE